MKKILFVICLVISLIFTSCTTINVKDGSYLIVREIKYPHNDNTVKYKINVYDSSNNFIDHIIIRDEANKYQINDTLILEKKCAYSH